MRDSEALKHKQNFDTKVKHNIFTAVEALIFLTHALTC